MREVIKKLVDWQLIKFEIQQRWKDLAIRKHINRNRRAVIIITNLSVIILIIIIISSFRHKETVKVSNSKQEWYYDLNTGGLFTAKAGQMPPIEAPSGPLPNGRPAGVRAYVFSYVAEPNESERHIGFLETKDPNYIYDGRDHPRYGEGMLIKRVKDKQWFPSVSRQGRAIFQQALMPNENGETPYYYPPK